MDDYGDVQLSNINNYHAACFTITCILPASIIPPSSQFAGASTSPVNDKQIEQAHMSLNERGADFAIHREMRYFLGVVDFTGCFAKLDC